MNKKLIILTAFVCAFCLISNISVFASEDSTVIINAASFYKVESVDKNYTTSNNGSSWEFKYQGYPAGATGEIDSISFEQSYSHTFSGTISASRSEIEASLGYSFGKQKSFSITKYSRALSQGEYVKAYSRKYYNVSKVTQQLYNGYVAQGIYAYVYGYEAIMPQLKLEYYTSSSSASVVDNIVQKATENQPEERKTEEEVYELDKYGNWQLINVTSF
ncbi:hypothetical protein DFR58_106136 [Anaerobacterium chartisolvens]|uniref:Uncharacterized protein n=1 Tax=Anaerobacterium chartisolvens TaxID=1297424 RepID=A0A369BBX5_9FIRM|nr:hypothetical protein [Anaerobacterium chartisolvens]RCX17967.1 hypothetical protein DFR58_106136 [Anaerobacterium chartisolvens]